MDLLELRDLEVPETTVYRSAFELGYWCGGEDNTMVILLIKSSTLVSELFGVWTNN